MLPHMRPFRTAADPADASDLVCSVAEEMGRIDVLVNNACMFEHHQIPSTG